MLKRLATVGLWVGPILTILRFALDYIGDAQTIQDLINTRGEIMNAIGQVALSQLLGPAIAVAALGVYLYLEFRRKRQLATSAAPPPLMESVKPGSTLATLKDMGLRLDGVGGVAVADQEQPQNESGRLSAWCDESTIERINNNITEVGVLVRNPGRLSIVDVSLRIQSLELLDAVSDTVARRLSPYAGLPMMLRDDREQPPRQSVDIHPGTVQLFHVATLQRIKAETVVRHAVRQQRHTGNPAFPTMWSAVPSELIPNGRYRIRLVAQGRDVPAVPCIIVFENREGRSGVWPEA